MRLRRGGEGFLRVGHRGLAALAPENSLASLAEALRHGLDLVEFDVVERDGALALAHSPADLGPDSAALDEALAFLAGAAPAGLGFVADLKTPGAEAPLLAALRRHGLLERTLVSSAFAASLVAARALEPAVSTGLSYPWDRLGIERRRGSGPLVAGGLRLLRRTLPYRIGRLLRLARADAALVHWGVVSPALVARCHASGAALFAWTVEEPAELERVVAAGVDGVVANDPALFAVSTPI